MNPDVHVRVKLQALYWYVRQQLNRPEFGGGSYS
ncbi:hypothetical protein BCO18430_06673 [Burkholderia contaminans]|nr:hypothetical protein BCO18430_06673 [Burkholderia contaminans]